MSKTIWKYPLKLDDLNKVSIPVNAKILTVQMQHGQPCLWAIVDPEADTEQRSFLLYETGHTITSGADRLTYVGTFQSGMFVGHLFEATTINRGHVPVISHEGSGPEFRNVL